jgi:hypothetical protein
MNNNFKRFIRVFEEADIPIVIVKKSNKLADTC